MQGFVTTRYVLLHPAPIVRAFGLRVYLRCLFRIVQSSGRVCTFLECI